MTALKKIVLILCCGLIFGVVCWTLEPPQSLAQATISQILLFFVPLFFLLALLINIFFGLFFRSLIISSGLIILLVLKSLDTLNLATLSLTFLVTFLMVISFKKWKPLTPANIRSLKLKQR